MEKRIEDPYVGECIFKAKVFGRRIVIRIFTSKFKEVWDVDAKSSDELLEVRILPKGLKKVTCDCGLVEVSLNNIAEITIALTTKMDENTIKELLKWVEDLIGTIEKVKILPVTRIPKEVFEELGYKRENFFFVKTPKSS